MVTIQLWMTYIVKAQSQIIHVPGTTSIHVTSLEEWKESDLDLVW